MHRTIPFTQGDLIKQLSGLKTKGLCFRLTFKWAALKLAGGEFAYGAANAFKLAQKHTEYRTKTLALETVLNFGVNDQFDVYTSTDWVETKKYLNIWGAGFTGANSTKYTGVYVEDQSIEPIRDYLNARPVLGTASVLAVFYGRRIGSTVTPWGHVVAFCTHGGGMAKDLPCFFDANTGEWAFDLHENIPEAIRTYIKTKYSGIGTMEHFNTIVLKIK